MLYKIPLTVVSGLEMSAISGDVFNAEMSKCRICVEWGLEKSSSTLRT